MPDLRAEAISDLADDIQLGKLAALRADAREGHVIPDLVGTQLYANLLLPTEGRCEECDCWTERRDDDIWLCEYCDARLAAEQERDHYLDSPTHGQAAAINGEKA